jgi:transmembrane sensor
LRRQMAERETSQDIDQSASDWTARLDRGPLGTDEEEALQAWLSGDPRRRGAFLRAQAVSMISESAQALGPHFDPRQFELPASKPLPLVSRRKALTWGSAAVAATASLAMFGIGVPAWGAISTKRGEIRLVPLADGSTVMLNTETSVRVHYGDTERTIDLLSGEAYFTVIDDRRRPFVVAVDGRHLRASHAAFRVRKLADGPADVLVQLGQVELPASSEASRRPVLLSANTQLTLAPPSSTHPVQIEVPQVLSPSSIARDLAWREGKVSFEGESLDKVAATFARYSDTRIIVADPSLAREPVTGLFDAHDPAGFARAIATVFGARVHEDGKAVILTRGA